MAQRPNFLLIITDQHRADHLGCYGNRTVRTPSIDRLAASGTLFERFYVATPICMPNRATLMTGRMPSLHGARQNGIPLSLTATTFVDVMRAAGYETALIGKCHLQSINGNLPTIGMPAADANLTMPPEHLREADNTLSRHGRYDQELPSTWEREADFEPTLPYYGFEHVELAIGHGDKAIGHYARWLKARHPDPDSLRGPTNQLPGNDYVAPQAWRTRVPEGLYPTAYVAERTMNYLENYSRTDRSKPFFIQCSFPDPHHPFTPPGRYWNMYDPAAIALPPSFNSAERVILPHLQELYEERAQKRANRDGQRTFAITEREAREAIALTYGMITMIDDAVGSILGWLQTLRLDQDTVVLFTSDHGDFMGDHQLLLKGALHYRGLVRVPFIWSDPQSESQGIINRGICGTLDIAKTILTRAGLGGHNGMQGENLMPAVNGGHTGHDSLVIEEHQRRGYMGFKNNFRARTLITESERLTLYEGVKWGELYDFTSDPDEMNNLWDSPKSRDRRHELTEKLARKMMDLADSSPLATHHGP
ncbi:MAG TPA: sulfatase-like hydrolase/transferase [Candidatus Binatia bacterium]|nr:sulfatase-like hydrolase/transferase [Candidatus Binatia bacterium]